MFIIETCIKELCVYNIDWCDQCKLCYKVEIYEQKHLAVPRWGDITYSVKKGKVSKKVCVFLFIQVYEIIFPAKRVHSGGHRVRWHFLWRTPMYRVHMCFNGWWHYGIIDVMIRINGEIVEYFLITFSLS